jgi:hypothetical protein
LDTLVRSIGEEKYFKRDPFWLNFLWVFFNRGCRGFLICITSLQSTKKPNSYEKKVDTIALLTPKGLWIPYMEFRDFGHTITIPISNWIFETFVVDGKFKVLSNKPLELFVKSSKESTEPMSLLKIGNKVVEVGWVHSKVVDEEGTTVGSKLGTSTLLYSRFGPLL